MSSSNRWCFVEVLLNSATVSSAGRNDSGRWSFSCLLYIHINDLILGVHTPKKRKAAEPGTNESKSAHPGRAESQLRKPFHHEFVRSAVRLSPSKESERVRCSFYHLLTCPTPLLWTTTCILSNSRVRNRTLRG